jgi:hypothetical protein
MKKLKPKDLLFNKLSISVSEHSDRSKDGPDAPDPIQVASIDLEGGLFELDLAAKLLLNLLELRPRDGYSTSVFTITLLGDDEFLGQ